MTYKSIFEYKDYKAYLTARWGGAGRRTGERARAAKYISCQLSYLSMVLNGKGDFSLEQAYKLAEFLSLDENETRFWILLVQRARAGTKDLERFVDRQIAEQVESRKKLRDRIHVKTSLSREEQLIYYQTWYYSAIHMSVTIPEIQNKSDLAEYLKLPTDVISQALEYLIQVGLVIEEEGQLSIGTAHLHSGQESLGAHRHHMNWRHRALVSLDQNRTDNLHYSLVFSCTKKQASELREKFVKLIQENLKELEHCKEEAVYCNNIDFFKV